MVKEKPGFLTPKAISNRIKSKGLQKLRWYCQMCQKQCRDENGYKCHTTSEAHHRQMKLFMENGGKFISSFSKEFLKGYLDIVRRQFGGKRVHSNVVYQEYIKDKEHIHMNSTRWHSLTGLCLWLGKQGICKVDETEKGWYVEYIDRDPEKEKRKEMYARLEKTEDEVNRQFLEKQIEYMREKTGYKTNEYTPSPLLRDNDEQPLCLDIQLSSAKKETNNELQMQVSNETISANHFEKKHKLFQFPNRDRRVENPLLLAEKKAKEKLETNSIAASSSTKASSKCRRSALDEIMLEEERFKEKCKRKNYWLTSGIEVKLINHKLPRNLLYCRAVVTSMEDDYTAIVRALKCSTKLKVDQDHVQTTIPEIGENVLVVNGAYRGDVAILKSVNKEAGTADIHINSGLCRGRMIKNVMLEDICKLAEAEC